MRGKNILLLGLLSVLVGGVATIPATAEPGVAIATDQVLAGLYAPQQWYSREHIAAVNAATGKNVSLGGIWVDVDEPVANVLYMLEEIWSVGATPLINIHVPGTAKQVVEGAFDPQLMNLGTGISFWLSKGQGRSVLLAPMPEMNGDWIPYGVDPVNFKAAYRHFVYKVSQGGFTAWPVRWVFAPNGWSTPPYKMADYYPGADVVDLVGMSAYNWGTNQPGFTFTSVQQTMGGALNEARTFAPEKPFLIAQTGSSPHGGDKDAWLRDLFTFLADDPNAVGFLYFNIEKEHDWAIYKGGAVAQGWKDGMAMESTVYQWPLTDWFGTGSLLVDSYLLPFDGTFSDDDLSLFTDEIEWLAASGITQGCGEAIFCPTAPVTRGEMASFLSRALSLSAPASDFFSDDNGTIHEPAINAIAAIGVTTGCTSSTFCPNQTTTRAQMASFIGRAMQLSPSPTDYFTDDESSIHEADINALRQAGITTGCTATTFCPTATITREQMAAFLYRTFAVP